MARQPRLNRVDRVADLTQDMLPPQPEPDKPQKRTEKVMVRMTPALRQWLEDEASSMGGLSLSDVIVMKLEQGRHPEKDRRGRLP